MPGVVPPSIPPLWNVQVQSRAGNAVLSLTGFFIRPFYKMMLGKPITLKDMESVVRAHLTCASAHRPLAFYSSALIAHFQTRLIVIRPRTVNTTTL